MPAINGACPQLPLAEDWACDDDFNATALVDVLKKHIIGGAPGPVKVSPLIKKTSRIRP